MGSLARAALACVVLLTGLLVTLVGTAWLVTSHYRAPSTDYVYCPSLNPVTSAKVTVNATITTAGVTYPRLENTVDIVVPMGSPGTPNLFADVDSKEYREVMGCLLSRPYWQEDLDQRTAPPTITTGDRELRIHHVSAGDLYPRPSSVPTTIGYFNFYLDEQDEWTLDLAFPHLLMGSEWSVTINAPPDWLNSPQPAPAAVPGNARMVWGPIRPSGEALEAVTQGRCLDPATCLRVKLEADTPRQLLAEANWVPGGLLSSLLTWAPWFVMLAWSYVLVGGHVVGHRVRGRRAIGIRRILLPVLLISGAAFMIMMNGWLSLLGSGSYDDILRLRVAEGMVLIVLAVVSGLCWGLSPLPTGLVGGLALAMAGIAASNVGDTDSGVQQVTLLLLSAYVLLFTVLAAAGFLSALCLLIVRREPAPHPEYLCWIAGTVIALALLAERDGMRWAGTTTGYWLSPSHPTYADMFLNLVTFPTDLSYSPYGVLGALVVGALLRAMFDTAAWDNNVGHPLARSRLLTLGAAVFFAGVDWDVALYGWPLCLWVIVLPIILLTFRRFRSILDKPLPSGWCLRSAVLEYGLHNLREDAKRWRATIREGRSIDKRLGQGDIEIADHRAEVGRIRQEADRSRGLILAHRVDEVLVDVTPIDLLLTLGPYPSRTANARFAAKVAALCGLPFLIVLTSWRWISRGGLDGNSYLLSVVADALWMSTVLIGSSAVIGLIWQHLPGRRGPLRVLPLVGLYLITPALGLLIPYLTDTEKSALGLVQVICFLAVATCVGLAMDLRALREIRPPWQLRMQALAFAYGTENLPAQIAFLTAQISAVIALVTFVKTGGVSEVGPPSGAQYPGGHSR